MHGEQEANTTKLVKKFAEEHRDFLKRKLKFGSPFQKVAAKAFLKTLEAQ